MNKRTVPHHPRSVSCRAAAGYTLIELLLYVSIVGMLLMAVTGYFATAAEARVKNQSIAEVNQQGQFIMDHLTRTIRTADTITVPSTGACGTSLTLTVPTGSLSPTVFDLGTASTATLGHTGTGTTTDSANSNFINATRFTASASGTISVLQARIGASVAASPNNRAQMALYSGATAPTALLAASADTTITANSWVAFCIPPVTVTAGQTYWLAYNTNGLAIGDNNLRYQTNASVVSRFVAQTYGTWPASWTGTADDYEFSTYATIDTGATTVAMRIKEGVAEVVPLTSNKVHVTGLTVQNISRSGTPGAVRVSFVVSRVNPGNRSEYRYQKTFTTTMSLR